MDAFLLSKAQSLLNEFNTLEDLKSALSDLKETLLTSKPKPTQSCIQEIYQLIFEPLTDSFSKDAEIAIIALIIHNELLSRCENISPFLSRLIITLTRIVTEDYLDNENVHSTVSDIVTNIISVTEGFQLTAVIFHLLSLMLELLENSFKDIKAKTCKNISVLCKTVPFNIIQYHNDILLKLISCMKHPDFNVRTSSLEALGHLVYILPSSDMKSVLRELLGSDSDRFNDVVQFNRDNALSNMIRDEHMQVRDMFFRVVCDWLLHLASKRELQKRLLPIILVGLFDPIEEVRETCWEQIVELGIMWENENSYPTSNESEDFKPYPWHPFYKKPRIGVKILFTHYFNSIQQDILHEISNFMSPNREIAAKLLFSLLILTESANDSLYNVLNNIMISLETSNQNNTTQILLKCIEAIGRQIPVASFFPIITSSRSKPSIFCSFICTNTPIVSSASQLSTLTYLSKGNLDSKDPSEFIGFFSGILRFVRLIERSRESLFFAQALIDTDIKWPENCREGILRLLLEHDHESIPKFLKKIRDSWYLDEEQNLKFVLDVFIKDIQKCNASEWKASTLTWPVLSNICKHCGDYVTHEDLELIFIKIFSVPMSPYHIPSIRLMKNLQLHNPDIVNKIILKCLLGTLKTEDISLLRSEALQLLKLSEHHNVEMSLFEALSSCIDDSQLSVQMDACDEIHRQFTFVKIYGVEKFTKAKDQSNIITKLMLKLISMLERGPDQTLNCLYPLIDVIGLFPEEIDINAKAWSLVLKRLVTIVIDEDKSNVTCKELAHLCIIAVTNSSKPIIIDELNAIARASDKKTADYIASMLSLD
ncbi:hypothetical protein SteCoe_885 [Stentor coeruleus]|uniref:Dynein axonemal assembly factor 5 TPR repeats domain-containing protein n=1 Tax=Stentor coeruleus TaxID=5963 RepID=A0A1R2D346_9CILI|nr:hypothetical protein SteCoe_885 [Stentor coeruleus]